MITLASILAAATWLAAVALPGCGDHDDDSHPVCPVCGDGVCSGDETTCNCPRDCSGGICLQLVPTCGDSQCDTGLSPGESHERCPQDCPLDCRAPFSSSGVFVGVRPIAGDECPSGTTEAYRDHKHIVCNFCESDSDCPFGGQCVTRCGPGCEDDTDGCCGVRDCFDLPPP